MTRRTPTNFILGKLVKDHQGDLWKISAVFRDSIVVVHETEGSAMCVKPEWLHERTLYSDKWYSRPSSF